MSKEHRFEFNNTVVVIEEPYKDDSGCVMFGERLNNGNINVFWKTYRQNIVEFFIELQKYIIDLELKLAEKEQTIEGLQEINKSLGQTCNNDLKEIERLREQLADKEKELNYFKGTKLGDFAEEIRSLKQTQNQKAIDELEKLLEKTQTLDVMVQSGHYINQKKVNVVFTDTIDQQIKSLKGEK